MNLPDDVRAFLQEIAGKNDLATWEREAQRWKGSGDLNEEWLSVLGLEARQLLDKYQAETGGES